MSTDKIVDIEMADIPISAVTNTIDKAQPQIEPESLVIFTSGGATNERQFPDILIAPGPSHENKWFYYPIFTIIVSAIDLALMIWVLVIGGIVPASTNAMLGPSAQTLLNAGGKWTPYILEKGQWWRLISASYLHAGIIHLISNLLLQVSLGWILERKHGTIKFAIIYIVSGIGGILTSAIFIPTMLTVGASGALMGIVGMWIVDIITNLKMLDRPWLTLLFLVISLLVTFGLGLLPFVDNFAHIGGFLFGIELSIILVPSFRFELQWKRRLRLGLFFTFTFVFLLNFIGFFVILYTVNLETFCPNCRYVNCIPYVRNGVDWCDSGTF